jgi:hypothetical protein
MTIFRSSAALASLLAACSAGHAGDPPPDPSTPIGKIFGISTFKDRAAALKTYAEKRFSDPKGFRAELLRAGFTESRFRDETGVACQRFDWTDHGAWPVVVLVGICGKEVFTNAGQIAP